MHVDVLFRTSALTSKPCTALQSATIWCIHHWCLKVNSSLAHSFTHLCMLAVLVWVMLMNILPAFPSYTNSTCFISPFRCDSYLLSSIPIKKMFPGFTHSSTLTWCRTQLPCGKCCQQLAWMRPCDCMTAVYEEY